MEYLGVLILAAGVFGACFAIDKLFTRLFRSKPEHTTGKAVRLDKKVAAFGVVAGALGIAVLLMGSKGGLLFYVGGCVLLGIAVLLIIRYITFGVYYGEDTFLVCSFRKKSTTYRFDQIRQQKLYNNQGNTLIELYLDDGETVMLDATMNGAYTFLDEAFSAWLRQTGNKVENCPYYDPHKSCWFPPVED